MAKTNKAYMDQTQLISIILAIIPITNLILGAVYRFQKGKTLLAILNIFPFFWIFYWVDLVSTLMNNDLKYLT